MLELLGSFSLDLERAVRLASVAHRDQVRKGSGIPYIQHPMAVAMILDRSGFAEPVVIAGLLHDVVEDTDVTLERVRVEFGDAVASLVDFCSEVKLDADGRKRPWIDRKQDHLLAVVGASDEARAVVLADKLHNLISIQLDLREGRDVWAQFNAGRDQVLWYYRAMLDACKSSNPRLAGLAEECASMLEEIASSSP